MLEYCTIDGDQIARWNSIVTIIDSNGQSCLILKNYNVIHTNLHSVKKIKLYDEYNQDLIHNPLAEWHWLDKCILQPGSIGPEENCGDNEDHDVTNNVTNKVDGVKVDREWTECQRQNEQRWDFVFFYS